MASFRRCQQCRVSQPSASAFQLRRWYCNACVKAAPPPISDVFDQKEGGCRPSAQPDAVHADDNQTKTRTKSPVATPWLVPPPPVTADALRRGSADGSSPASAGDFGGPSGQAATALSPAAPLGPAPAATIIAGRLPSPLGRGSARLAAPADPSRSTTTSPVPRARGASPLASATQGRDRSPGVAFPYNLEARPLRSPPHVAPAATLRSPPRASADFGLSSARSKSSNLPPRRTRSDLTVTSPRPQATSKSTPRDAATSAWRPSPRSPPAPSPRPAAPDVVPMALSREDLVHWFERIEGHFEAVNGGQPIPFEALLQPKAHALVPCAASQIPCDVCAATPTAFTCAYRDCPARLWACHRCREDGVRLHPWPITKQKEWAYPMLRRWFESIDKGGAGQLDFLQFLYFSFEVAPLLTLSPAHTFLLTVRHALDDAQGPTGQLTEAAARSLVRHWLGSIPSHTDTIFLHMARSPGGTISRHNFLKLLYSVVSARSKYLSQSVIKLKKPKPRVCTVNRTERVLVPPRPLPSVGGTPELRKIRLLGKGGQGMVWEVLYRGLEAAAKVPHADLPPAALAQMVRATELQAEVDHPNVLRVYDIIKSDPIPTLVLELAQGGDVDDLYTCLIAKPLQWRLAREVADAVHALHTHDPPIAHRDLKGANVLLSKDLHAKLADFDMALPVPVPVAGGLFGTPGFMAPEVIRADSFYDHRVDIFSYGSLLYEITHNNFPFCKEVDQALNAEGWYKAVMEITMQGLRPQLSPACCPPPMRQLIVDCWAANPDNRPSMSVVIERLESMQHLYE